MPFTITWLGQGGFTLALGQKKLAIDPYLSNSVFYSCDGFQRLVPIPTDPEALAVDTILFSHDHLDHLDPDTVSRTDVPEYAGPPSCLQHLTKLGIPSEKLSPLGRGEILHLGDARIMAVPAKHTDDAIGIIVQFAGVTLYFTADTLYDEILTDIGALNIDILFTCINGKLGNMDVTAAARLAKSLPCRLAVPVHYGMFAENTANPDDFQHAMELSGIPVWIMEFNRSYSVFDLMKMTV